MVQGKRILHMFFIGLMALPLLFPNAAVSTRAAENKGTPAVYAGAGALLDPRTSAEDYPGGTASADHEQTDVSGNAAQSTQTAAAAVSQSPEEQKPEETKKTDKPASTLVMADVNEVMNVREEPDASSEKIGVLYKDCGGTILEQQDGWTKLKSGDLIGWASNDYLLFGEEAEKLAKDVGVMQAKVLTDSLRVRKTASKDGGIYGLVKTGDRFEVIREDDGSGFVLIDYDGKDGYVSSDYVEVDYKIDHGETLAAIRAREEAERARKAKLTANQGAVKTSADEVKLLAALIMCEAGNQPYEGQLGVGAVVMNRVRNAAYPNTVVSVIYASGQFSPAGSGHVADAYNSGRINASCMQAAQAAINGETSVGSALHFRRAGMHEGTVIGGHVFW